MFKRANKITSLLVAAAAVVSLAPTAALAADLKKIDSEDGVVYNAVAYKDGKAVIDGEVEDNDGAYYYADGKYTELEDVDSGASYSAYGAKYANVDDGDYFVDLDAGTVTDDSVDEDDEDDAASALRKAIKDADRYGDNTTIAAVTIIPGTKFADNWYATTSYKATTGKLGNSLAVGAAYNLYTDAKGNYIDADYNLGKIKVETTNDSATIENTTDTEDLGTGVKTAAYVRNAKVLGQDKDYIYRYVDLTVTVDNGTTYRSIKINNKSFDLTASGTNGIVTLPVIQKISKAQDSDDIDDGKYAKTVYNYVISKDDASERAVTGGTTDRDKFLDLLQTNGAKAAIVGGKLAVYYVDNTEDSDDNVFVQAVSLKSKNGYYYTDVEEQATIQGEYNDKLDRVAADTDVDGNIYVIDGGYVKEFDGTDDWNKVYKVDGSMNALSVYDKDNMVTWSQGDEVYSLIGGKTTDEEGTTPETPATTGWAQAANGTWSYVKADGTKATGWLNDGGVWYFLKADGTMATGWVQDGATWYYLQASGAMATGWLNDNGTWYYLNASGAMLANTTVDGYVLGASGAWVK